MKNLRTTIGGAIGILGTGLVGIGVGGQLSTSGEHSKFLWWLSCAGWILSCVGKAVDSLFAADAKQLQNLTDRVDIADASNPPSNP